MLFIFNKRYILAYNINNTNFKAIKRRSKIMYIDVLLQDTNMLSFDEFVDFDYKINSSDNNEILIGNCSAASLNFSIWNKDKQYNNPLRLSSSM